jgi:ketosteroid isomerase-like protein
MNVPESQSGSEEIVSQANVSVVHGIYDAFGRGDVDAVFGAMTPDIEWDEAER